ncbi:hypothetical protein EDB84DRAFT_1442617 [Lactarius hengduanensis]|nr:hypothetical protein EDB84DRAFT_1442617 [Lactarius hengduanensis]
MDISLLLDYIWCDYCSQNKVKCVPRLGAEPPYTCFYCEDTSHPCLPPAALLVCARHRAAPARCSGLSTAEPPVLFQLDYRVPSGTDCAAATVFWQNKFMWAGVSLEVAQAHFTFVQERYAEVLGEAVVPVSPSLEPPSKHVKVENGEEPVRAVTVEGAEAVKVDGVEVVEVEGPAALGNLESEMVDA